MKYTLSILFSLVFFIGLDAQRLHDPREILRMMEESKISYEMVALDSMATIFKFSLIRGWPEEQNGIFRIVPYKLEPNSTFQKHWAKGGKYYRAQRWSKAIKSYKKAYEVYPESIPILTKIGETYARSEDYLTAIYWYENALKINYHDFKIHHLLAEAHLLNGDLSKAQQHILTAHLLNRLDHTILSRVEAILTQNKLTFAKWELQPKIKVSSASLGQVEVAAKGKPWMAYANVEAVWDFEPDYVVKMTKISNQNGTLIRLKEAMLNALIIYDELEKTEQNQYPELEGFKNALHGQFLNEYLVYEKLSLAKPTMLYAYNEAGLNRFIDYLLKYRVSEKKESDNENSK